jgi:hypothetical protein
MRRHSKLVVTVLNDTADDMDAFCVVRLARTVSAAAMGLAHANDEERVLWENYVFDVTPPDSSVTGHYGVTQSKIEKHCRGPAMLLGVTKCRLNDATQGDYATPQADNITHMVTGASGKYPVLTVDSAGNTDTWGIIVLGAATAAASSALKFAKVSARAGTEAPYNYSGYQVEHDGSAYYTSGHFTRVSGGDAFNWTLINAQEIGDAGEGVAPLPLNSVVAYGATGDVTICTASQYRGTY